MKRILKLLGIVLAIILVILICVPLLLEGKIGDIVKKEGNKMLNAQFDFENLDISLIRNFPKASITLEDFWLKGIAKFQNDTLIKTDELRITVDLASLFGDNGFDISQIILNDTYIKAIINDSAVNWDIMKNPADAADDDADKKEEGASSFKLNLKKLSVKNLNVVFDDRDGKNYACIEKMDAHCSGNFGADRSVIKFQSKLPSVTYKMNGIPFLNKSEIKAELDIDADFKNNLFTLKDNGISINAIRTSITGWLKPSGSKIDMDLKLNSNEIDFKEILSLIPAIYAKDFKGLKTEGKAVLSGYAKGSYQEKESVPAFDINLLIKDAMFHYPSLPAGVNDIQIAANVKNPGGDLDATTVKVAPLSFVMAGNKFSLNTDIKKPVSDPDFKIDLKGKMDLGKIKDVYPLENIRLNGLIDADANLAGRMSYIDKKQFDRFIATGAIKLNDMLLELENLPKIYIKQSTLGFSSQYLELSKTDLKIGKSDLTLESRFENYLGFLFKKSTIKGNLNIGSGYFNLNEMISGSTFSSEESKEAAKEDTTAASGILRIPGNIDFKMDLNMKKVLFDKLELEAINGILIVKDGKADMKNLSFNTMGGLVKANGFYSTPQKSAPSMNAGFAIKDMSFSKTFATLDIVQKFAPIFKGLEGTFSGHINMNSQLDNNMSPVLDSFEADGNISTDNLNLGELAIVKRIASQIPKLSTKNIHSKDIDINFAVKNGRVATKPFNLHLGDVKINLAGSTGLDQTIDYKGKVTLPKSISGTLKVETVDMEIKGTFSSPKVGIDLKSLAKKAAAGQAKNLLDRLLKK